jgi:hypothetical protein
MLFDQTNAPAGRGGARFQGSSVARCGPAAVGVRSVTIRPRGGADDRIGRIAWMSDALDAAVQFI